MQSFLDGKYDLANKDIEGIYFEQRGDVAERIDELNITKRMVSTGKSSEMQSWRARLICPLPLPAKLMQTHRTSSGSSPSKPGFGRSPSVTSSSSPSLARTSSTSKAQYSVPPPAAGAGVAAPPPYSAPPGGSSGLASAGSIKKAPPPPPPLKRGASAASPKEYCVALFDFAAQAEGDLSFSVGDRIEIVERSESADDWWTGRLNGAQGVFPGSYTQLS